MKVLGVMLAGALLAGSSPAWAQWEGAGWYVLVDSDYAPKQLIYRGRYGSEADCRDEAAVLNRAGAGELSFVCAHLNADVGTVSDSYRSDIDGYLQRS